MDASIMFRILFLQFEFTDSGIYAAHSNVRGHPSMSTIPLIPSSMLQTRERTVGERLQPTLKNAKEELSNYRIRGVCSASARALRTG